MTSFKAQTDSLKKVRDFLDTFFVENKICDKFFIQDFKLAAVEIITNIIKHSQKTREFSIDIFIEKDRIILQIKFTDKEFTFPVNRFEHKKLAQNGFGMYLIKNISDELNYDYNKKSGVVSINVAKRINTCKL
jgi:anti-sigma regulatory factor (Ser/Thr protein kinase)